MFNIEDEIYDEFHYICKKCKYDRGILDHSQYNCTCPECGSRYYVTPTRLRKEKIEIKPPVFRG